MAWKLTEQIRQRLVQLLQLAIDKDDSLNRFDDLRQELQEKSGEFGNALFSDDEMLATINSEIFQELNSSLHSSGIPATEERIRQISQNLFESFLESIPVDTVGKVSSKFNAKSIYNNLLNEISSLPTTSNNFSNAVEVTTKAVFDKLIEILANLLDSSDKVLLEFNRKAFDALLFALNEDRDQAGLKYEEIRQRLIRQFRARGSHKPQAHADEVFNRVARRVLDGVQLDQANSVGYFHETARLVLLEYQREVKAELLPPEDLAKLPLSAMSASEELLIFSRRLENEIGIEAIEKCRTEMSDDDNLLRDLYDYGENPERIERRKMLAKELGVKDGTLRKHILDLNKRFKNCVLKQLYARPADQAGKSP